MKSKKETYKLKKFDGFNLVLSVLVEFKDFDKVYNVFTTETDEAAAREQLDKFDWRNAIPTHASRDIYDCVTREVYERQQQMIKDSLNNL